MWAATNFKCSSHASQLCAPGSAGRFRVCVCVCINTSGNRGSDSIGSGRDQEKRYTYINEKVFLHKARGYCSKSFQ